MGFGKETGVHDGDKQSRRNTSLCMSLGIRKDHEVVRWTSVYSSVRQSWEGDWNPTKKSLEYQLDE